MQTIRRFSVLWAFLLLFVACKERGAKREELTLNGVMDSLTLRVEAALEQDAELKINQEYLLSRLRPAERKVLAERYWRVQVNVPVVVSVLRDSQQEEIPFWLLDQGFEKTEERVENELTEYELWKKEFPKGEIGLGINGFDKHRMVYFVGIAPQNKDDDLQVTAVHPAGQMLQPFQEGSFTYLDWDQLVLTKVPERLRGQVLLNSYRGRAREAHLVDAFRSTPYPSSAKADQVRLTWQGDPQTSVTVQWRTNPSVQSSKLLYWKVGGTDTLSAEATASILKDRLLRNDREVKLYRVPLTGLSAGTKYGYSLLTDGEKSADAQFQTAEADKEFSFLWFGDTHNDPRWGALLQRARKRFPEAAFYSIAGDLVNTGLHRDDWDQFFHHAGEAFAFKPLLAVPGNHDSQDGLGAALYQEMLAYPDNGPLGLPPGLTYSFSFKNALFLQVDVVSFPVEEQAEWIAQQLKQSTADWKFVTFHFPPYNQEEEYPDIVASWVPLFDQYGVDLVLSGHYHYYLRTHPLKDSRVAESGKPGTVYLMSIGTRGKNPEEVPKAPHLAKVLKTGYLYQHVRIQGNKLTLHAFDSLGNTIDRFELEK